MERRGGDDRVRILIAGGGTGGHLYPAIAIARELQAKIERCDVLMVGTSRGLEARVLPEEGLPLATIPVAGLKGKGLKATVSGLGRLPLALVSSMSLVGRHRPRVVIGVGGYASGPVVAAAILRRRPTLIHEQNMIPGSTNRWLAPWVSEVVLSFEETRKRLGGRGIVTGNPVRREFGTVAPRATRRAGEPARLLVFGGSQGASAINRTMVEAAPALAAGGLPLRILHQSGRDDVAAIQDAYARTGIEADVRPYIKEMARAMGEADLVIARAGATTVAELTASGRGSILVPFPQAIHDHQTLNARALEKAGAAVVVPQSELTGAKLAALVLELLGAEERLGSMADAARRLGRPGAASEIADVAIRLMSPPLEPPR